MTAYDAVINDDWWSFSTDSAEDAVNHAAWEWADERAPDIGHPYDVIVYRNAEGEDTNVVGWADRGRCTVTYAADGMRTTWTASPIVWDGVAVRP